MSKKSLAEVCRPQAAKSSDSFCRKTRIFFDRDKPPAFTGGLSLLGNLFEERKLCQPFVDSFRAARFLPYMQQAMT